MTLLDQVRASMTVKYESRYIDEPSDSTIDRWIDSMSPLELLTHISEFLEAEKCR